MSRRPLIDLPIVPLLIPLLAWVLTAIFASSACPQSITLLDAKERLDFDGLTLSPAGLPVLAGGFRGQQVIELQRDGSQRVLASGLAGPTDLAFDADGALYVSEFNSDSIRRIDPDGTVSVFARVGRGPAGLDIDSRGNLYVSIFGTGYGSDARVARVSPSGEVTIVANGGGLFAAIGLAVDTQDRVYAANWHDGNVFRVSEGNAPQLVATIPVEPELRTVLHLAAGGGRLFATTPNGLYALELDGSGLQHLFVPGAADKQSTPPAWDLAAANGLHASRDGRVLHLGIPNKQGGSATLAKLELPPPDDSPKRLQELLQAGHAVKAATLLKDKFARGEGDAAERLTLGNTLFALGDMGRAAPQFELAATTPALAEQAHYGAARCHARLGDLDAAFTSLDASLAAGNTSRQWMLGDPELAALRADPRWEARLDD
ncbi:MAG: hypothetical protein DHS20C15_25860 [Planctomycetota bacterium]|nr:MAG: hypothetical protein DHS20C15_25860 [Planctomycetota bacterium]